MTGNKVAWRNKFKCEIHPKKIEWLQAFSKPEFLTSDVTQLADAEAFNYCTQQEAPVPRKLFLFTYGFCCTDLSNLNNHSSDYKGDCLDTGAGKTGKTWKGNISYVELAQPEVVMMENVPSSRKGNNFERMQADVDSAGYVLADVLLNSHQCGLPQDRWRAWFVALRKDLCRDDWRLRFVECAEALKLPQVVPLSRFILPCSHPYVQAVQQQKKQRLERKALQIKKAAAGWLEQPKKNSRRCKKGGAAVIAKPTAKAKAKVRSGRLWQFDHWKIRLRHNLPAPTATPEPEVVKATALSNSMCDRERDLMRMFLDVDVSNSKTVELKHSAPRVIRDGTSRRRPDDCTSCLLPSSKIMVFPPVTETPRFARLVYRRSPRGMVSGCDVLCAVVV